MAIPLLLTEHLPLHRYPGLQTRSEMTAKQAASEKRGPLFKVKRDSEGGIQLKWSSKLESERMAKPSHARVVWYQTRGGY